MRIFKCLLLFVIAISIVVSSCKKDGSTKSKKDILTSHQWKYFSYKENGVLIPLENCEKDDFLRFEVSGTYTYNPGIDKCSTSDVIENGTWSISSDAKTLFVSRGSLEILELTDSKFVINQVDGTDKLESTFVAF